MRYSQAEITDFLDLQGLFENSESAQKLLENPIIHNMAMDIYEMYEKLQGIDVKRTFSLNTKVLAAVSAGTFILGFCAGYDERQMKKKRSKTIKGEVVD